MVEKLIGRLCGDVRFSIKVKLRLLQFFTENFQCLFVWFFSGRIISIWAQWRAVITKKNSLLRMIKKDDYSVKNKSSNVTVSRMGKCYSRFPSSHFFVLCPRRKLKKDRATDSNIAYFLYKPKKPIRIWLNHSWANQRKLIEVDWFQELTW